MNKRAFYLRRINDHIQYLQKIRATLHGSGNFRGTGASECPVGKWIYGEALEEVCNSTSDMHALYETLLDQHRKFHESSDKAIACHEQCNELGQYREMTQMHLLSNQMVQTLLQMDRLEQDLALSRIRAV